MTYYYNITRNRSLSGARLWTDRIFLSLLLIVTIAVAYYNLTELNLTIAVSCIVLFAAVAVFIVKRQKMPFVEIKDDVLRYFDTSSGEMVSISVQDITHISTRFCELNVHTSEGTHSLNLDLIRCEKARWEIKEVIREITRQCSGGVVK